MPSRIRRRIEGTARLFGYNLILSGHKKEISIYRGFPVDMDDRFKKIYEVCREYTVTSIERMYALYKAVEYIVNEKIPGDFVECGVWKGGSSMVIAKTLLNMKETKRKIYLYDTFAGMSKPTEKDMQSFDSVAAIKVWRRKQKKDHNEWAFSPIYEVKKNMLATGYPEKNIVYVEGKVEDTIPETIPAKIALLRLDTDWYESTYHELKHLFPLVSYKGVLIIDDYGHFTGAKEATDKYLKETGNKMLLNRIDYTGRLGIKLEKSKSM